MASERSRLSRRVTGAAVVVGVMLTTSLALAEENARVRASKSFDEARSAFGRGDYTAAAAAFEQAAELVPHPATWLNAAEAWEARGDWVRTAEDCDRALAIGEIDASLRSEAEARLARTLPRIATLELRGPRTISVALDGGEPQSLPRRRRLTPGAHRLAIADVATGRERTMDVNLAAGSSRTLDVEGPASPAPTKDATPSSPRLVPPLPSIVAFGAAGLFGAGAAGFGLATVAAKDDFDANPTQDGADSFKQNRTITNVLLGAAVVSAVTGVVLWIVLPSAASGERTSRSARRLTSIVW